MEEFIAEAREHITLENSIIKINEISEWLDDNSYHLLLPSDYDSKYEVIVTLLEDKKIKDEL